MEFEWDDSKQESDLRKHRLDFADVAIVFAGATFTIADHRFDYGEDRFVTFGLLRDTVVVVAHSERGDMIRVISMRKATKHEQKIYYAGFAN